MGGSLRISFAANVRCQRVRITSIILQDVLTTTNVLIPLDLIVFFLPSEFLPRKPVRYLSIDIGRVRLRFLRTVVFSYIPNPLRPGTVELRLYLAIAHLNSVAENCYQLSLNKRKPRIEHQEQHAKWTVRSRGGSTPPH